MKENILEKLADIIGTELVVEGVDISATIKSLIDTNFSASDEEQGKASQMLKGLLFSEDPIAKKFVKDLDKALSGFDIKKYQGKIEEQADEEDDDDDKGKGKKKKNPFTGKKKDDDDDDDEEETDESMALRMQTQKRLKKGKK